MLPLFLPSEPSQMLAVRPSVAVVSFQLVESDKQVSHREKLEGGSKGAPLYPRLSSTFRFVDRIVMNVRASWALGDQKKNWHNEVETLQVVKQRKRSSTGTPTHTCPLSCLQPARAQSAPRLFVWRPQRPSYSQSNDGNLHGAKTW
jgi:hypothetical protein